MNVGIISEALRYSTKGVYIVTYTPIKKTDAQMRLHFASPQTEKHRAYVRGGSEAVPHEQMVSFRISGVQGLIQPCQHLVLGQRLEIRRLKIQAAGG